MKLAYQAYGEAGPRLIVLHGLFGSARNWAAIARQLADHYRVVAVDLRNHGASPWAAATGYADLAGDVAGLITAEGWQGATLLGHSMGGKAAMTLALSDPGLIDALVVADIAPVAYPPRFAGYIAAMRGVDLTRLNRRGQVGEALADAVPDAQIRGFLLQNLGTDDHGRLAWRINLDALAAGLAEILDWQDPPGARPFARPALFMSGAHSDYIRTDDRAAIRARFPKATFTSLKNAGHWLHAEQPAAFVTTLRVFLGSVL